MEYIIKDLPPGAKHMDPGYWRLPPRGEQEFFHVSWEVRFKVRLLKIVDEQSAPEPFDRGNFFGACARKVDVLAPQAEPVQFKKPLGLHPRQRGLAEVRACVVVTGVFGLVADNNTAYTMLPAGLKKLGDAINQSRLVHPRPVHNTLQSLPFDLPIRQSTDVVADGLFAGSGIGGDQTTL